MKKCAEKKRQVNRQFKNNLFIYLFTRKKEYALSLYNAINNTNHTNAEDLEFKLLENVLFIRMKNDVSFIFDSALNLYEHQSTFSKNMPLRGLFYFADLYRKLIPTDLLHQKTLIKIPVPKYIVFYNGPVSEMQTDRLELRLSDAFQVPDETGGFEWTATVLNINPGFNEELFAKCDILREYTLFVEKVKKKSEEGDKENAMKNAIKECVREGILRDFFEEGGEAMLNVTWEEIDYDMVQEILRKEAIEEARKEGLRLGIEEGRELGIEQGIEKGRAEAEHTIMLLMQENDKLKKQLATLV